MPTLFFSYSHKDEGLRNELETHLAMLKRQGIIEAWHDRRIGAGSEIDSTISQWLDDAQIILLLVSAHVLASDYCYQVEMKRAMENHSRGIAKVIPVILHPCEWHSAPFGGLRATPTDGKPVSMFANQHEALAIVAKDVREAALSFLPGPSPKEHLPAQGLVVIGGKQVTQPRSSNLRVKRYFDDHEKDQFMEESYEYIVRYFSGSLLELENRNPHIKTRFKQIDNSSFTASIYDSGKRVAVCSIWYGGQGPLAHGIAYVLSDKGAGNSLNESLRVVEGGHSLCLKPLGMLMFGANDCSLLSQEGAAEYLWTHFLSPLQD